MQFLSRYILCGLILAFLLLQACQNNASEQSNENKEVPATPAAQVQKLEVTAQAYLIEAKGVLGISPGTKIESKADLLEKSMLQDGEGDFVIYNIKDESGEPIGYLFPDPSDETVIGNIVITSPKAETLEGVGVGITFQQLEEKLGELEVHGSEIEGRTYARKDNLSYRLKDIGIWSYEVDKASIAPETEISEIVIW